MFCRACVCFLFCCANLLAAHFPSPADWRDESIYMVFTDRFADGDASNNEATPGARFRPTNPRGIHGGDFKGIRKNLDYIKNLGATAIWITPVFLNDSSSAWHGYGAIDFTTISPQLGGLAGLRELTQAAHDRGLRIILDVVVNHVGAVATSDDPGWPRFRKDGPPYKLRWINADRIPPAPFNRLDWFHDRGQVGNWNDPVESVIGQFYTLNDLKTKLPEVRAALTDVCKKLIEQTDCDGFRVDTVRHVEREFWPDWLRAMRQHAATLGKTNFLMFGEVHSPNDQLLGSFTTNSAFDSLLDFPLYYAIDRVIREGAPTRQLTERFQKLAEPTYSSKATNNLVTFIDNHDLPRFLAENKAMGDTNKLTHALVLLYTLQGIPCLYYGTEQGFNGRGDPQNREDMKFDATSPLYHLIKTLNRLRKSNRDLRAGPQTIVVDEPAAGLFAFKRGASALVVLNTSSAEKEFAIKPGFKPQLSPDRSRERVPPNSAEIWIHD